MSTATASTTASTRTREVLPFALTRDYEGARPTHPQSPSGRPASIKEAIMRWLNEEL
ncbi:MAG TPA: hypothetical protein VK539_28070 [Myxococcaceae bacterium]|nr:hypothetical protein [Myxococcaceae bacterium]